MTFQASRLRLLRESRGMSREQLAVTVGRSFSAIRHYEDGTIQPSMAALERLAAALDVHPGDLFDDAEARA